MCVLHNFRSIDQIKRHHENDDDDNHVVDDNGCDGVRGWRWGGGG